MSAQEDKAKLEGYVERIIYRNEKNGYSVLEMDCGGEEITAVGTFPYIEAGAFLVMTGEYTDHPVYGTQFRAVSFEEAGPQDAVSIERYLGSGAVKGVGPKLAARIVKHFGVMTLEVIEKEPEKLAGIKGISSRMAGEIAAQVIEKRELRDAMLFLQKYGISAGLSLKIYKKYGDSLYRVVRETPYKLAEDIEGVGFRTADEIARKAGLAENDEGRIKSGILYTLNLAQTKGHMCLPEEELTVQASEILGVDGELAIEQLSALCIERKAVRKALPGADGRETVYVYSSKAYYAELEVAAMLVRLNVSFDDRYNGTRIPGTGSDTGIELDEAQRRAVEAAFETGVTVLTGGPGTGKTTTINEIIRCFEEAGMSIRLAAPTGRAAKRIQEATGREASTIHRMLELGGAIEDGEEGGEFLRDEDNPLEEDVIIIDEMSMVDIYLMRALLRAMVPGTRLILVGDENQLPSVGPGSVLRDIIASGIFRTVRLTRIFRQAAKSDIVTNSHRIIRGEPPVLDNHSRDFFFLRRSDATVILRVVLSLVQDKLPRYVHAKSSDIQVLTPTRKGVLGVENLNRMLQHYLNPPSPDKQEVLFGRETRMQGVPSWSDGTDLPDRPVLRTGDKVMQIKNNYRLEWEVRNRFGIAVDRGLGIFNGDMGIVRSVNAFAEEVTVEFDEGRMVEYPFSRLEELELAYAVTVHKSQGSEYPAVVIPLLSGPRPLMNRNLIYTAVTRARTCVTIVGSEETFNEMVKNGTEQKRYTGLSKALESYISPQMSGL